MSASCSEILSDSSSSISVPSPNSEELYEEVDLSNNNTKYCRPSMAIPSRIALSMSGCGFLCTYHFGSVKCFQQHSQNILKNVCRYSGASAGSLVAALLAVNPSGKLIESSVHQLYDLADEINSLKFGALTPSFSIMDKLEAIVDQFLPENAHELCTKCLVVSVTKSKDKSNHLKTEFVDRNELIKHLLASCYIPVYAAPNKPPVIDGEEYVDGGLTNNLPKFDDCRTITVSPFTGEAEISPLHTKSNMFDWTMTLGQQIMNVYMANIVRGAQALFPPPRRVLESYYIQGFQDTMRFLKKEGCFESEEGTEV